jgi:hypothetical protein
MVPPKGSSGLTSIVALLICAASIASLPPSLEPIREGRAAEPVIKIHFDESSYEANVTNASGEVVEGTGYVEATSVGPGSNVQWIKVDLQISAEGWSASISPSEMLIAASGGSEPFTFWVNVAAGTETGEYAITVGGYATLIPGGLRYTIPEESVPLYVNGVDASQLDDGGGNETDGGDKADGGMSPVPGFEAYIALWASLAAVALVSTAAGRRRG